MKRNLITKGAIVLIIAGFILQGSRMAYSMISPQDMQAERREAVVYAAADNTDVGQSQTAEPAPAPHDADGIRIDKEVLQAIEQADASNYEKNLANYKNLLVSLEVHEIIKEKLEQLIKDGHAPQNLWIAYMFLYENYGKIESMASMLADKELGKAWADIFREYNRNSPEYVPASIGPDLLQKIMTTPGMGIDDITIADRCAYKAGKPFGEVVDLRFTGMNWKDIKASLGIVNSEEKIPYVPISPETVKNLVQASGLAEQQVLEALVVAHKVGVEAQAVIDRVKEGTDFESIYAAYYEEKYR